MMVMPGVPAMGHVTRGFWHPGAEDGCVKCEPPSPVVRIIRRSDVARCPKGSLAASHYNDDGTCRCNQKETS